MNKKNLKNKYRKNPQSSIKTYSFDEVLKKNFRSKKFQRAYEEELARLRLAQTIRKMRMAKKYTQKFLAEKADMPQSVVARIESGKHSFSLETLNRIAHVFNKEVQLV